MYLFIFTGSELKMMEEISSAIDFLIRMLKLQHQNCNISEKKLDMFRSSLTNILRNRYKDHWFPENPNRGSAYRCLRINSKMDPIIAEAINATGLHVSYFRKFFPFELTLWIDPQEVSYRIGENGSICVLYNTCVEEAAALPPPRESPELYLDPRQMEQPDPMADYVMVNQPYYY